MGPEEEIQPPFASSSWLNCIRGIQFRWLHVVHDSVNYRQNKTECFRRIINNSMHYDPMKAFGLKHLHSCRYCAQHDRSMALALAMRSLKMGQSKMAVWPWYVKVHRSSRPSPIDDNFLDS